jgi:hypothetical protein
MTALVAFLEFFDVEIVGVVVPPKAQALIVMLLAIGGWVEHVENRR